MKTIPKQAMKKVSPMALRSGGRNFSRTEYSPQTASAARRFAARDDVGHAAEADADPDPLPQGQPFAQHDPRDDDDEDGHRRADEKGVDRLGRVQADIGHGLEHGRRQKAHPRHQRQMRPHDPPVSGQAAPAHGQEDRRRQRPAPEGQAEGRHIGADRAAQHPVPRPEQRGERGQRRGDQEVPVHGVAG
jgi:hypothetical protein